MDQRVKDALARIKTAREEGHAEFLLEGSAIRVDRAVRGNGKLRMCPLQFLGFYERGVVGSMGTGDLVQNTGLPWDVVATIIEAADSKGTDETRLALLAATGIAV